HTTTDSTPSRYSTKSTMSGTKSTNHPLKIKLLAPGTRRFRNHAYVQYAKSSSGKYPELIRNITYSHPHTCLIAESRKTLTSLTVFYLCMVQGKVRLAFVGARGAARSAMLAESH
ncbi:hypothetical protein, partial [Methylophilus sp.]|uniref:hypothetical protein n=1 Tax=Methylophilus sp. TaxID=29541 RepID=UPI004036B217